MKTILLIVLLGLLTSSCKKDNHGSTSIEYIILKQGDTYKRILKETDPEAGWVISHQPSHYLVSELRIVSIVDRIYVYQPAAAFIGMDQVDLEYSSAIWIPQYRSVTRIVFSVHP